MIVIILVIWQILSFQNDILNWVKVLDFNVKSSVLVFKKVI